MSGEKFIASLVEMIDLFKSTGKATLPYEEVLHGYYSSGSLEECAHRIAQIGALDSPCSYTTYEERALSKVLNGVKQF